MLRRRLHREKAQASTGVTQALTDPGRLKDDSNYQLDTISDS